jgi:glycosyltransferase involved in cell wall biosynthesis
LISAGRFVPLKGFDLSIIAFSKFLKKRSIKDTENTSIELFLVGSGPEEDYLKSLAKELGIASHVTFISWIERSDLMDKFKNSSAFLFPSHEGAGMVVAEALSFALPVICLDNEGPGEFVTELCAFKIKHSSHEASTDQLAASIHKLYVNPTLRTQMGLEARKHFLKHFHWDRRGETLQEIYHSL